MKNVTMMIRVPEPVASALKPWADEEYLSVNKLVTRILAAEVKRRQNQNKKASGQTQGVQRVTA